MRRVCVRTQLSQTVGDALLFLFYQSAEYLADIARAQSVGEQLLNVRTEIYSEIGHVFESQMLFGGDFVFYKNAVMNKYSVFSAFYSLYTIDGKPLEYMCDKEVRMLGKKQITSCI